MNNNKISNMKTEVPETTQMNDKDYITDMLATEKDMLKNYCIAMTEASNEELHNQFKNFFNDIDNLEREIYELMFQKGWYSLEKAESQKIQEKYNMLSQQTSQLCK